MRFNGLTKGFFIFILALVTWAFFDVLSPYFSAILWAAILTVIFNPVKNRLRTALGDRNGLASLLTIGIICLIVFIPLMVILSSLAIELNVVYTKLQENNTQFPEVVASIFNHLPDWASGFLADHNLTNAAQIQKKLSDVALQGDIREFFLDLRGVGQVVIRQEAAGPVRQMVEDACHHFRELGVVLLKLRINHVQLNGERGEDHHQRDKDDQADNTDGQQRGKPVAIPQRGAQPVFYRVEDDGQNGGPQYCGEVGRQHVEEGPGHKGKNKDKETFGQSVKAHQSVLVTKKLCRL